VSASVLIVDDDELTSRVYAEQLRRDGTFVQLVKNAILSSSSDMMIAGDIHGTITLFNEEAERDRKPGFDVFAIKPRLQGVEKTRMDFCSQGRQPVFG
jgi:CheY-like chemotaxis protein